MRYAGARVHDMELQPCTFCRRLHFQPHPTLGGEFEGIGGKRTANPC
ncbi:MAG: hypothetical protein RLZ81_2932 [Pseudomonadota bacterium]|jgi:hypothetical protein